MFIITIKIDEMNYETISASQHKKYQTVYTRSHLLSDTAFHTA
jgi:hypothetical protein